MELGLVAASTLFTALALYYSYQSAEASRDQAASARTALYFGAQTESFVRYSRSLRDFCLGFAPDGLTTERVDVGSDIPAVHYFVDGAPPVPQIPETDIDNRLKKQVERSEELGRAMDELRVWLPDAERDAAFQTFARTTDMASPYFFKNQSYPAGLSFDAAAAACLATQQRLMSWYSDDTGKTPLETYTREDVAVDLGGGQFETQLLTIWGLPRLAEINKDYRRLRNEGYNREELRAMP